jgi:hypothetical protein
MNTDAATVNHAKYANASSSPPRQMNANLFQHNNLEQKAIVNKSYIFSLPYFLKYDIL